MAAALKIGKELRETMKYMVAEGLHGGGAGLAAPQVGVSTS